MRFDSDIQDDFDFISECLKAQNIAVFKQKILLTGGTGFLGSWLLCYFMWANDVQEQNNEITIVTRDKQRFLLRFPALRNCVNLFIVEHDLSSPLKIEKCFDLIIHGATDVQKNVSEKREFDCAMVGTQSIISIAKQNKGCRVIYLSSGAVYGSQPLDVFSREVECTYGKSSHPQAHYSELKMASERLLLEASSEEAFHLTIARCFTFVGAFIPRTKQFAISEFIQHAMANKNIVLQGNPLTQRSYMYCADFVVWVLTILSKSNNSSIFNLGSSQYVAIGDLAQSIIKTLNSESKIIVSPSSKLVPPGSYLPDTHKAESELGLKTYTSLESAILKTYTWMKNSKKN